ncbi:MAG TPA: PAS domain S-box protein [Geobacteraceae bacterium]
MAEILRILHLEDDLMHASLAQAMLAEEGIACVVDRVETEADFAAILERGGVDLVLADFTLPSFDGTRALAMVRERWPDLPFIFFTGTMGEETAIESLKSGATDYVLKNRLARLAPAVRRALAEAAERRERRRAEEELRHSNELFRSLFTASPLAVFVLDPDGTVRLWSSAAERIFGWTKEEAIGSRLPYVPQEKEDEFRLLRERVIAGESLDGIELQRRRKDGSPVTVNLYAAPIYDRAGQVVGVMSMLADITEHKQVERDLVQSEQRFRAAFEDAAIGMCLTGADGRFLAVNHSLCDMLGYTRQELLAMSAREVTHPGDVERSATWTSAMLANETSTTHVEKRYVHRDGRTVWAMVSKFLLRDSCGTPLYFINQLQDITERKNLENQLRHAQKMEAIGTLTGGIAHDFNNLLTAIIGYGCLIEMKMDRDDPLRAFVEQIMAAGDRAAALTQSLLAFGRKQAIDPRPVDLNGIVRGVEKLLLRLLREDIVLRTSVADEVYTVLADTGQIEQVLMNLATNARDAMPRGGELAINTSVTHLDREFIRTHGYGEPGEYALLCVSDSGTGMDEATAQRIFEPFFTTKDVGKGTGLGLSVAYGIVKQHNGYITCYSEPGNGTTFRIYLPAVNAEIAARDETPGEAPRGGTETILLAEDDHQVRVLTRKLLERFGYTVIEATDGKEALAKFLTHGGEIDLAILDVIMPEKNGRDVYEEMVALKPGLKALFTSGYSADILQRWGMGRENLTFVSKPTLPIDLLKAIRSLLDA